MDQLRTRLADPRPGQRSRNGPQYEPKLPAARSSTEMAVRFDQRLTCTIAEARETTGLGRATLYKLITAGTVESTTIGRRRLVLVHSLLKLLGVEKA